MATRSLALATDLYQLTMAAGYFAARMQRRATFELFVRELPESRAFLLAAGLDQALEHLEGFHFSDDEIAHLRRDTTLRDQPQAFFDFLRALRFTGEVWAMPEGTPVFANEPLLRVTAPIIEAQLVETALLAIVNFQTMIASKAARVVTAADGRDVVEFGSRRAHGTEAAMYAARAAYLGGAVGSSNVEAGFRFSVPVFGTMAHSFVMSFEDELEAFRRYTEVFPHSTTLLLDTYDTVGAARKIVAAGLRPQAVRLDSGDLDELSRAVRAVLDAGGLGATRILASGDLDEWRIAALVAAGAPIDAFGVGTRLSTSFDAPALGGIYKLVELEVDGSVRETVKTTRDKATFPGRKQVWRSAAADGAYESDLVASSEENAPAGATPLLTCVMSGGERSMPAQNLSELRARSIGWMGRLPAGLKSLDAAETHPVKISDKLRAARRELVARYSGR